MSTREKKRRRGLLYLTFVGGTSVLLVVALMALQPVGTPLSWGIRATALLGYLAVFLTAVSSAYMRELFELLGCPFIRVHHILSVAGLVLITLHPLGVAMRSWDLRVFLPDFSSVSAFLKLGGRPAWYLIGIASLAALFRTMIRQRWRSLHLLNYVAFLLATAHAVMIGTDFVSAGMRVAAVALVVIMVGVLTRKRVLRRRASRRG